MSSHKGNATGLPVIHDCAAGIDVGSRFHVVAVGSDLCKEPVQTFQAFTSDLQRMADWLVAIGIKTVAMESTGVYCVPVYEVLGRLRELALFDLGIVVWLNFHSARW